VVVSDIHLADAEPPHPKNPLWKRFKRPAHFVDRTFRKFLDWIQGQADGPIELILNGDIFDFDSVMALPRDGRFRISWLEHSRGLASEEAKSRFKIAVILKDHDIWRQAIRDFVLAGHRVVFVIGNHDMELHWPGVQRDILDLLELQGDARARVRFCEWFYVSNSDTLIEHGNQYDSYNVCPNPVNPLIRKGNRALVRIPFGNLAGKYMLNGMGLMNPHASESFIKESIVDYIVFWYRYVVRTQPFLVWTWFWGAWATLLFAFGEGLLPAMSDPLTIEKRVQDIAKRSNSTPEVARTLRELHVHSAVYNPLRLLQELWLDRAALLGLVFFGAFQIFSVFNLFGGGATWFFVPLFLFLPIFIFYSRTVSSAVEESQRMAFERAPLAARVAGVSRAVQGHTHLERHTVVEGVEYLNTGTWSPAYRDVECTQPFGAKCFAWIKPTPQGREAALWEWKDAHDGDPKPIVVPKRVD
jgi:UDP-2,3-diacylglucosamine pyrophosphatase LpxH